MSEILDFMVRYGTLLLFVIVFVEQMGIPLPSPPFLLAAGTLVGGGKMNGAAAIAAATLASLLADIFWFYLGRMHGNRILSFLCRISLEPDSCVRQTENLFTRYGVQALAWGKFVPGLGTVMPPLAGIFGVSIRRFVSFDAFGSFLYAGCFLVLGVLFSNQLQRVAEALGRVGRGSLVLLLGLLAAYVAYKYVQRQRVLRKLRVARITVDELRRRQEQGEAIFIVDLRSGADLTGDPFRIIGSIHLHAHELESRHHEIPRDRDVVLYCSCPNEVTSARAALSLHKRGISRVRPLQGGINAWRERNYPLVPHTVSARENAASAA